MSFAASALQRLRRAARHIGRAAVFVLLLVYAGIGSFCLTGAFNKALYERQDLSAINDVIKDATANGTPGNVTTWINARPASETDALIEALTPHSGALESSTFFALFHREVERDRMEEALFWFQLARYRLRYDILRCEGNAASAELVDTLTGASMGAKLEAYMSEHPEMLKKTLRRVLDFDAKYPAMNSPEKLCKALPEGVVTLENGWDVWRRHLRKRTEAFINEPDEKAGAEKPPAKSPPTEKPAEKQKTTPAADPRK